MSCEFGIASDPERHNVVSCFGPLVSTKYFVLHNKFCRGWQLTGVTIVTFIDDVVAFRKSYFSIFRRDD